MILLGPNWRQHVRNPSIRLVVGIFVFFLVVSAAILGPTVIKDGIENYQEVQRLRSRDFVPPPGAWIRPWLVTKAEIMIGAEQPIEWHPTDFMFGPCSPDNTRQLPSREFREAIIFSCGELSSIQLDHALACAETNRCNIPEVAKDEIRAVIAVLDAAFANAGFVEPITEEQSSQ